MIVTISRGTISAHWWRIVDIGKRSARICELVTLLPGED
jgi:hypothetical protein